MRKAAWGAILLGVFAFTFGSPIREDRALHGILSLAGLGGYLLLSMDPPATGRRQFHFLVAGAVCSLASFLLVILTHDAFPANLLARVLAVATVALPLWLVARHARSAFIAAAALGAALAIPGVTANDYVGSLHAYVTALTAFWVSYTMYAPGAIPFVREKNLPQVVVASNIVTFSEQEKTSRLAELDAKFKAGEIPEHKYWDKRQEIESR